MGLPTATLLVVASMIGTGVFTTTGFLLEATSDRQIILGLWATGGLLALFGALSYAELTAALPVNGGEYQLLSRIYRPWVGFLCGWASFIAGFAAPIGGTALAFGEYFSRVFPNADPTVSATILLISVAALHALKNRGGARIQDLFTIAKVIAIVTFIGGGGFVILSGDSSEPTAPQGTSWLAVGTGLIYISYAYLGWNAATYVAGELKEPARSVPRALLVGTASVTLLYVLLNAVFLYSGDPSRLVGELEVGHLSAQALFGDNAARFVSGLIALGLVSTVGALTVTGPRIYEAMGKDYPGLAWLSHRREGGGPWVAIGLQTAVALLTVYTATYDQVLIYVGMTLSLFGVLTVAGVHVLRRAEPELPRPYRAWGYPWTGLIYCLLMLSMVAMTLHQQPKASLAAVATLLIGYILHRVVRDSPHSE
jgi:APA family basic amino acid/polyamine antiporter